MARLNLFVILALLTSVMFGANDVRWVEIPPEIDAKTADGEYFNVIKTDALEYAYAYNKQNFYLQVLVPNDGERAESAKIMLNKDLSLEIFRNGSLIQTKGGSNANYEFAFLEGAMPRFPWLAEIEIPFKDLGLDKNCEDTISYSIEIIGKTGTLGKEDGIFESSSCWATPQAVKISPHEDTPKNQTDSPAALSRHYLVAVYTLEPPGYPNDYEGAKIESISLKLGTNANAQDIYALAFIGPDGLALGAGEFDEEGKLTFYPDDAYVSGEPRTMAIEFQISPNAQYFEQDGKITPAYYRIESAEFNFSGRYTKANLPYEIEGTLESNYINLMQCTRAPECGLGEICSDEFVCIKANVQEQTGEKEQNSSQPQIKPAEDKEIGEEDNSMLLIAGLAAVLAIFAVYFILKNKFGRSKQDDETANEED